MNTGMVGEPFLGPRIFRWPPGNAATTGQTYVVQLGVRLLGHDRGDRRLLAAQTDDTHVVTEGTVITKCRDITDDVIDGVLG